MYQQLYPETNSYSFNRTYDDWSSIDKLWRGINRTNYWYSKEYINKRTQLIQQHFSGNNDATDTLDMLADYELLGESILDYMNITKDKS